MPVRSFYQDCIAGLFEFRSPLHGIGIPIRMIVFDLRIICDENDVRTILCGNLFQLIKAQADH